MKKILTIIVPILSAFILNSCQKDMVFDLYGDSFKIYYTTVDGRIISLNNAFSREIISHTYENGQGVIITNEAIKEIVESCFQGRIELTSITIPDSVTSIGHSAFNGCSSLTNITIPNRVTWIGRYTFRNCSSLINITIPNSVAWIGDYAFRGCENLTSVTIGNSVTEIGEFAFASCNSLTSITIPDSVTSIVGYAFYDCSSLKEVYCKPTTPPAGYYKMFTNNAPGRKIYVPRNSVDAYTSASDWRDYAADIVGYDF